MVLMNSVTFAVLKMLRNLVSIAFSKNFRK